MKSNRQRRVVYIFCLVVLAALLCCVLWSASKMPVELELSRDLPISHLSVEPEVSPDVVSTESETTSYLGRDIEYDGLIIPAYSGSPYISVNNDEPFFTYTEYTTEPFETYSELDELGRCGVAYANVCLDIMPEGERDAIGSVKPTGWQTAKYEEVSGGYLYNRCHLIGYQLAGENANRLNLITGTRYLNIDGMLEHENWVDNYVENTGNHVLYRVTPVFYEDNLVADGVLMEGYSVEDNGEGVKFCIFAYNVQPGIAIDYATGDSWRSDEVPEPTEEPIFTGSEQTFVINLKTGKFHKETCSYAKSLEGDNREEYIGIADELILQGFEPCGKCHPDQ